MGIETVASGPFYLLIVFGSKSNYNINFGRNRYSQEMLLTFIDFRNPLID